MNVQSKTVEAAGYRTHYLEAGTGSGLPLILLHGSGHGVSAAANWNGVIEPLAEAGHRVLAVDIAGFGDTEFDAEASYSIKLWVSHLLGFMDALGIERAIWVGNSFGGGLSLAAATRNAHRVVGMVLLGTPAGSFAMTDGLAANWTYEPSRQAMEDILRMFPHDQSLITDDMIDTRYEASIRPGALEAFRQLMPAPADDTDPIVNGVPESVLESIEVPTVVVHGLDDHVIPPEIGWRLATHLPNVDAHFFAQCGHWVQHERRDEFVSIVSSFAGRLSS